MANPSRSKSELPNQTVTTPLDLISQLREKYPEKVRALEALLIARIDADNKAERERQEAETVHQKNA